MTEPGLFDLLRGSGIEISEGQVHNILMSESEKYQRASEEILAYEKVKAASFTQTGKEEVNRLYDELIAMQSISSGVNEVIASCAQFREEMLKALDYPGLPLHNNDSERDIRGVAKRRNISGSTKSGEGKAFRDGLMTLKQTCARLGISFMGYLTGWFAGKRVDRADIIRGRYRTSAATGPSG